jgi:uncharacterized protein involved in exopolysaccharide biosynthesis
MANYSGERNRLERIEAFNSALRSAREKNSGQPPENSDPTTTPSRIDAEYVLPEDFEAVEPRSKFEATNAPPDEKGNTGYKVRLKPRAKHHRWSIIALTTIAGIAIAALGSALLPDYFESKAELLVDPNGSDTAAIHGRLGLITSAPVLGEVANRLNLDRDPEFNGERSNFLPMLDNIRGKDVSSVPGAERKSIAVRNLSDAVSVARASGSYFVTIGARSSNPQKAALIANAISTTFINMETGTQSAAEPEKETGNAVEMSALLSAADAAEKQVAAFSAENHVPDPEALSQLISQISRTEVALASAKKQSTRLDRQAAAIGTMQVRELVSEGLPPSPFAGALNDSRDQYISAKRDFDRLATSLGDRHPIVLRLQEQLESMRARLGDQLRETVQSVERQRSAAESKERELASRLDELMAQRKTSDELLGTLRGLEQEALSARSTYENSLSKLPPDSSQPVREGPRYTLVSKAEAPVSPAGPDRIAIIAGGGLLGFVVGFLIFVSRTSRFPSAGAGRGTIDAAEPAVRGLPNSTSASKSYGGAEWPSPDLMPANPYRGKEGGAAGGVMPAAYRGLAARDVHTASFGPDDADIAALKERLEAFREKVNRRTGNERDGGNS